jgi:small redox-active disulfide protein 2
MEVEIPGSGCANSKTPYENVSKAVEASGKEAKVVKIQEIAKIMSYVVKSTPALVVDGKIVFSGKLALPRGSHYPQERLEESAFGSILWHSGHSYNLCNISVQRDSLSN